MDNDTKFGLIGFVIMIVAVILLYYISYDIDLLH